MFLFNRTVTLMLIKGDPGMGKTLSGKTECSLNQGKLVINFYELFKL